MEVAAWQLGIFAVVLTATLVFGSTGWALSVLAAVVWTAWNIFTSWLMALQLITVFVAAILSIAIHEKLKSIDAHVRTQFLQDLITSSAIFLGLSVIGGGYFVSKFNPQHFRLDLYALGLGMAYAAALFASAVLGGSAIWIVRGLFWRKWSNEGLTVGGLVAATSVGLALIAGQDALQRFKANEWTLQNSNSGSSLSASSDVSSTPRVEAKIWRPKTSQYGEVVRKFESAYPVFDPTAPTYDSAIVNETLSRKAFYMLVDQMGDVDALNQAVKDMLLPLNNRPFVQIVQGARGQCRFNRTGNRQFVAIDGQCPQIDIGAGLRQ